MLLNFNNERIQTEMGIKIYISLCTNAQSSYCAFQNTERVFILTYMVQETYNYINVSRRISEANTVLL